MYKLKKLLILLKIILKYKNVFYIGAPTWLNIFAKVRKEIDGYYSQGGQDRYIEELISKNIIKINKKIMLDIGCNHPILHSNSYYFENKKNYKVIAIDAIDEIKIMWNVERPNANFISTAVGSEVGMVEFEVHNSENNNSMFSSVLGASKKIKPKETNSKKIKINKIANILDQLNINSVGIISLDIEGYEYEALMGIDFLKVNIDCILVENNNNNYGLGDNKIRDLLLSKGYVYHSRFWNLDDLFIKYT